MSEKPHCFHRHDKRKMLKGLELLLERIKKFNEISRCFELEILEINFSHMGSYRQAWSARGKGTENA
jgi:hypothetical protein